MIRRSFRIGLALGLLGGVVFALTKMRGSRLGTGQATAPDPTAPWPPLVPDPAATEPLVPTERLVPDPLAPSAPKERPPALVAPPEPAAATASATAAPPPAAAPPAKSAAETAPPRPAHLASAPKPSAADAPAAKKKAATAKAPAKKKKAAAKKAPVRARWVEPKDGVCPTSHPVKAKLASKIFHLPGMLNYDRTKPDRCYRDPEAAVDDDLRPAKR